MFTIAKDKFATTLLLVALLMLFFILPEWQAPITLTMWVAVVVFCIRRIKERLLLLLFEITLFTFLMTRLVLPDLFTTGYITNDADGVVRMFDKETLRFIYTTLVISIFGSYLGYCMVSENSETHASTYDNQTPYIQSVRRMSKILSAICSVFYVAIIIEKAMFVFQNGYFAMYAEFDSQLPGIIHKLASLYVPLLYLFLATLPSKSEARFHISLYITIAIISLATGGRTTFMLALVFIFFYYVLRNFISPEDPWLSRKAIIIIVIAIPLLLSGMFLIDFVRADKEMEEEGSVFNLLVNFFYQQGTSCQVIGLTYQMQPILDDGRIFSFGQIIDNYNKNFVFQLMGTAVEYRPQTEEMAQYGHSLANTLTYYTKYKSFLSGVGLGTSYIAEVWHDFGYIGLILWNIMYGVIFAKLYQWIQKGLWACAFGLIIIPDIIYAPRGQAAAFLNIFFSVTILGVFLIIHLMAKHLSKNDENTGVH